MPITAIQIPISPAIKKVMMKTLKESSINTYLRQLKCLGLSEVTLASLKGNIANILNPDTLNKYANSKIYVNALLNVYKCVDYDEEEMSFLKAQFDSYATKSDNHRKQKKEESQAIGYFHFDWEDLQDCYEYWQEQYASDHTTKSLTNWFITALYSDEQFGAKRPVDICNLRREHIIDNKIVFTSQKNQFKYESLPLSKHILEPLTELLLRNKKQTLILTPNSTKYAPDNFYRRLKQVLRTDDANAQYLRRLWASYKYDQKPSISELRRQAYELTHEIGTHCNDYVQDYRVFQIIKTMTFRKTTKYIRVD